MSFLGGRAARTTDQLLLEHLGRTEDRVQLSQVPAGIGQGRERLRAGLTPPVFRQPLLQVGDFLAEGKEIARIIELQPILVTGDVTQRELKYLKVGARGDAKLVTGEHLEGVLRYVASEADGATRTFRVELQADNSDGSVVSGTTAELRIPAEELSAHYISPALLSLNKQDKIGVKSVDEDGVVVFHTVDIVRTGVGGVWVTGLPERVRVITVGQGFVREGDRVEAQADDQGA